MIYNSIEELIGNTPLLRIDDSIHQLKNIDLYAKLEYYNPFGSVKDRVAYGMLKPVLEEIKAANKTVIESSSGNTAKALSVLCSKNGLNFEAITNRIKYNEVRGILQVLGATIEELPGLSDCPDPFDPNDAIQYSRDKAAREPERYHLTDQYFNEANPNSHFATTGKELVNDLGKVDYFFGFLGTCGSTVGTGRYLKENNKDAQVFGIVGKPGHKIPGGRNLDELWEVGFFVRDFYSDILSGTTPEAIDGMLVLNKQSGILCGPTTGLVFVKCLEKLKDLDNTLTGSAERKKAVFIACDRLEPYLSFIKKHKPELLAKNTKSRLTVESLSEEMFDTAKQINVEQLIKLTNSKKALVIDVRGYFAFSTGHIPESINILDDNLASLIEGGPVFPRNRPIVIVCRIGDISKKYAAFLSQQGYEAYSLLGGLQSYKDTDYEVEKSIGA